MTFSSGLYLRSAPPAQQDPSLQVPIQARSQFDGLQGFFGFLDKGLQTWTDVLETRKNYKQQMAQIAQANDARAAQLAASGISAQDAINMAWEETRYAAPKTWAEVGQQNAVSDLAKKANNGWVGHQSSAVVLETATSQLETIVEEGLDGKSLSSLEWINGQGLQQIVRAVMPKPETMIALGKNGAWVRDQIIKRALSISDDYTQQEKDANLADYLRDGGALLRNAAGFVLRGEHIPREVHVSVDEFVRGNPGEAQKLAQEVFESFVEEEAYKKDMVDGVEAGNQLKGFINSLGIPVTEMDIQELARKAAAKGNAVNALKLDEMEDKVKAALAKLPDNEWNAQGIRRVFDSVGFTPEMYDQGLDDYILSKNTRFTTPLEKYELDIREGRETLAGAVSFLHSMTDSASLRVEWLGKFERAQNARESEQRSGRSLALQQGRAWAEVWTADRPFRKEGWESTFSTGKNYEVPGLGETRLLDEYAEEGQRAINKADVGIKQAIRLGELNPEAGQEILDNIEKGVMEGYMRDPDYWVEPPELPVPGGGSP